MKILYVTTIGPTMNFFKKVIENLISEGHIVDIATNDSSRKVPDYYIDFGCKIFSLSCSRSPVNRGNFKAIGEIRKIVEDGGYDIVHCHTPIAAACTRLACIGMRKKHGVKVFYTAHGFHFYKGAPIKNWMIYYPIEKICSHYTDKLITINKEDYELAQKKFKAKEIHYVPGVGIDLSCFEGVTVDRAAKRAEFGVPEDAILFTSVGELSVRKNQKLLIQAFAKLNSDNIHYAILGSGSMEFELKTFIDENQLSDRVHLLGFRRDVVEIYKASDVCCLSSLQEGLPVSVMEGMACGLPVICSRIRGNVDLIDENGGALFDCRSVEECIQAICTMLNSDLKQLGAVNKEQIKNYSIDKVYLKIKELYGV